ncbi:MAG: RadC family protein [Janthinobacterium lividum]
MEVEKPHYIGHRQRLKEKLMKSSAEHFADYELIELLLFAAIPRKDVKPLAKSLLKHFGSLSNLINSDKDKLLLFEGINENAYVNFHLVRELMNRILKQKIDGKNTISSWAALLDYLKFAMGSLKVEQFRTLFLNKKNILIADEVMGMGTIDQAPVYPREIIKRALFHEAGAIILIHNHPSGSSKPSKADLELTNKIVETCRSVNVAVHDHVIIAGSEYYSFKSNMLL